MSTTVCFAAPDVKGAANALGSAVKSDTKAVGSAVTETAKGKVADTKAAVKAQIVDINSATIAELKAVVGIGDAYAAKIIAGRPYANKAQLKSRKILPALVYEQVKDLIIAKQPKK
ncbi:MAG TPA: helix-hairpin-helix domain-containing protein [Desulfuromonadales bacterium]|nr:helix-hairpin-helix domain-containing protein [Desulfuromonadales bacterium]